MRETAFYFELIMFGGSYALNEKCEKTQGLARAKSVFS
jgi:hypothetical protein